MYLLELKQREYEYLTEFETYANQSPSTTLLGKMKVTTQPSMAPGTFLAEFGAELVSTSDPVVARAESDSKDANSDDDVQTTSASRLRSISAQYITDLYLHWVAKTREKESEDYIKTLSGE